MNFFTLITKHLCDRDHAIDFSIENGLIKREKVCNSCKKPMKFLLSNTHKGISRAWRCENSRCKKYRIYITGRKGTWFADSKMSIEKILMLTYNFSARDSNLKAMKESSRNSERTSSETVSDWYTYCMELCCEIVADNNRPIGGVGFTVEIDEGKFGKRKYNRGRFVDGQWVLGGVCRETKECFLVPVDKRDSATLIPIIVSNISPGTTIVSDCWRAYNILNEMDFTHLTVNHSLNFVDPTTGAYTQTIESTWWQIKRGLPDTHTHHGRLHLYLAHYIFDKMAHRANLDPFLFLIKCISEKNW